VVAVPPPVVASVELGVNSPRFPDFRRKRWADREFQPTVWDASAVGAAPELIGAQGSRSMVTDLIEKAQPDRRRERLGGTIDEQVDRLFEVIAPHLG